MISSDVLWIYESGNLALLYTWMENIVTFRTHFKFEFDFEDTSSALVLSAASAGWNQLTRLRLMSVAKIVFQISELIEQISLSELIDWLANHLPEIRLIG